MVGVQPMVERKTNAVIDMTGDEPVVHREDEDPDEYRNLEDGKTVFGTTEDDKGETKTQSYSRHLTKNQKKIAEAYKEEYDNPHMPLDADQVEELAKDNDMSYSTAANAIRRGTIGKPLYTDTQIVRALESLSDKDRGLVRKFAAKPHRDVPAMSENTGHSEPTLYNIKSNNEPLIYRLYNHEDAESLFKQASTVEEVDDVSEPSPVEGIDDAAEDLLDTEGSTVVEMAEDTTNEDEPDQIQNDGLEIDANHIELIEELQSLRQMYDREVQVGNGDVAAGKLALCEHLIDLATGEKQR